MPGVKGRLARAFLSFLDEHGDYRTQLEEAAARAAAAEANSLFANDRRGRKRKRRRDGGKLTDGAEEEDDLLDPPGLPEQLPEDPYEQIQFYYRTFRHRTRLQLDEKVEDGRRRATAWVHTELHHPARVPLQAGLMLAATALAWARRRRRRRLDGVARVHGILGKKLVWADYRHRNWIRGRGLQQCSAEGARKLAQLGEKAGKAEAAALASMRPYQRRTYERCRRIEDAWEWCVALALAALLLASGATLGLSLNSQMRHRGGWPGLRLDLGLNLTRFDEGGPFARLNALVDRANGGGGDGGTWAPDLDGHLYASDGPVDNDGYPAGGAQQRAEAGYAACLDGARERGADAGAVCDADAFFADDGDDAGGAAAGAATPPSPLRARARAVLAGRLRVPPALAAYLADLPSRTLAYLSSVLAFLLFLASHFVAHRLHRAAAAHDPMKHFVPAAADKTVRADGTVAAKKGETEAQRKRRERMLQNERLKAQMARLAVEAKVKVAERRARMEGADAARKAQEAEEAEEEEAQQKKVEEHEEIVQCHSRQFGMLKMGVPEGAVLNTFAAEGIEEEEAKDIIKELLAIKAKRAKEAVAAEEAVAAKAAAENKREEEKEKAAKERLARMKRGQSGGSSRSFVPRPATPSVATPSVASTAGAVVGGRGGPGGGGSAASSITVTTAASSKKSASTKGSDPAGAKGAMLGQIGRTSGPKKADPAGAKSAMLGQIGQKAGLKKADPAGAKSAMLGQIGQKAGLKKADPAGAKSAMLGQIGQTAGLKKADPAGAKSAMLGQIGQKAGLKKADPAGAKSAMLGQIGQKTGLKRADPAGAKNAMLGQIGQTAGLKKADPAGAKSAMLGQIGQKAGLTMAPPRGRVPSNPAPRPGSSAAISMNAPLGAKSDKRWDRESKTWVDAAVARAGGGGHRGSPVAVASPGRSSHASDTPKKSNRTELLPSLRRIPSRLKLGGDAEEKKGEEESIAPLAPPAAGPAAGAAAGRSPPRPRGGADDAASRSSSCATPVLVRISSPDDGAPPTAPSPFSSAAAFDGLGRRPSARDIRAATARAAADDGASRSSSCSTPVLVRISSPDDGAPPAATAPSPAPSSSAAAFDGLGRRPSARDIQATIAAVENAPDEEPEGAAAADGDEEGRQKVDLAPGWLHTPAFETALRTSNASWDRRPSSRDVIARIREVEHYEVQQEDGAEGAPPPPEEETTNLYQGGRSSRRLRQGDKSLAIIDESQNINMASSFEFRRKSGRGINSEDDDISELSEPTFVSNENSALKGRSVPQALFVPNPNNPTISPMVNPRVLSPMTAQGKIPANENMEKLVKMAQRGDLERPPFGEGSKPSDGSAKFSDAANGLAQVESEEDRKRRERGEARAKKMEAITARRNAGKEDDESVVSGISKRHRMRRKKKVLASTLPVEDATSQQSEDKSSTATPAVKPETEEERQRKRRAEARAKKLEAMAARRNASKDDDGTTVTGISRRHRVRRRKSALASITPGERERNDWKKNVYASVLGAEQVQWRTSIYASVLNAETARTRNLAAKHALDEQNAVVQRRREHQARLNKKAKKFAARAQRFHKMRQDGGADDDDVSVSGSVTSSLGTHRRRRRRGRKSSVMQTAVPLPEETTTLAEAEVAAAPLAAVPLAEEITTLTEAEVAAVPLAEERLGTAPAALLAAAPVSIVLTAEEKEKQTRQQWCNSVYVTTIQAEQRQWKNSVYSHAIHAEESLQKRRELEAQIAKECAAYKARREKARKIELRAEKMAKMRQVRDGPFDEKNALQEAVTDDSLVATVGTATDTTSSSMKRMMSRRKRAARKSVTK